MIKPQLLIYLVLCGNIFNSCASNKTENILLEPKMSSEKCVLDTLNTYKLYIPSHHKDCMSMPLVIVLDPHGSGDFAIKSFIEAADNYQCVVAASNLIRNNYPYFNIAIEEMIADLKQKLQLTGPIYIAGFSGGARMAIEYAGSHSISGIFVSGALANKDQISSMRIPIFSLIGLADFNFPEAAEYVLSPENTPKNLMIEISDLKHEWPSSQDIVRGLGFLIFKGVDKKNSCTVNDETIAKFEVTVSNYIDTLFLNNELIKSEEIIRNYLSLPDQKDNKIFTRQYEVLKSKKSYTIEMQDLNKSLQFEMKVRQAYYNALLTKDILWWDNEVKELNIQLNNSNGKYTLFAFKRIKAFLGILCYSECRKALQSNDMKTASKVLGLYKLIEPTNPDMFFYSAMYSLKSKKNEVAINQLRESLNKGFSDTILMRQNFPAAILERVFN
jgi:hypothetical protein